MRMFITSAGSDLPSNACAPSLQSSYRTHPSAHTSDAGRSMQNMFIGQLKGTHAIK